MNIPAHTIFLASHICLLPYIYLVNGSQSHIFSRIDYSEISNYNLLDSLQSHEPYKYLD